MRIATEVTGFVFLGALLVAALLILDPRGVRDVASRLIELVPVWLRRRLGLPVAADEHSAAQSSD